jgi:ribosomal protein S18 acetylase RimI-like enzyme
LSIDPRELEAICSRGWPAAEVGALGGWRLHASAGKSGRINTCWAHGAPDADPEAAIDAAEAWYAGRGLRPRFKVIETIVAPSDLTQRLARRGYSPDTPTLTMTGPMAGAPDPDTAIATTPGEAFRAIFADPTFGDAADAEERLAALARIPAPRGYALLSLDGAPAAIGTCSVEGAWAGVIGMRTAPAFRRRGLARRVFRALFHHAAGHGATRGYLQVDETNASAIALYEAEGFETAYRYEYWTKSRD